MSASAHRILNRFASTIKKTHEGSNESSSSKIEKIFGAKTVSQNNFHKMLVLMKVRKSDFPIEISILDEPVDLEKLGLVTDTYLKSDYLQSFGFRKVKIGDFD